MIPSIRLRNGSYFNFIEADCSRVTIEDIASALSKICRFTGQCGEFYSVAQHAVLCSYFDTTNSYAALMHDAAESLLNDCSSPLKQLLPDYKAIEHHVEEKLFKQFNVTFPLPPSVKYADLVLLKTEFLDIMHLEEWELPECCFGYPRLDKKIIPWSHKKAKLAFLHRYKELTGAYEENTIAKWWTGVILFFMK